MTIIDSFTSFMIAQRKPRRARILQRARRILNSVVAAIIAHRQRQAGLAVLRHLDYRELKDIGLYPSQIEYGLNEAAQQRARPQNKQRRGT